MQEVEPNSANCVVSVEPQLLDLTREPNRLVGSVRFRSVVSESPNEPPQRVDEVWHFVRDTAPGASWKLAGIEQV